MTGTTVAFRFVPFLVSRKAAKKRSLTFTNAMAMFGSEHGRKKIMAFHEIQRVSMRFNGILMGVNVL
jgi:hypothetical protein